MLATVSTKGEYNLHVARANKPKNIAIMGTVFSISDKKKCRRHKMKNLSTRDSNVTPDFS